jgi:hypothetical protein
MQCKETPDQASLLGRIGQPLNNIFAPRHTHDGHTGHLSDPPLKIPIVGGDDVNLVLLHTVNEAVIGIDTLVVALQTLPALVTGDAQRNAVFRTQLLEFGHDARCDDRDTLGVEGVHHGFEERQLALHRVREEIGIDQHRVGGHERRVVLEEEGRGDLRARITSSEERNDRRGGDNVHLAHDLALGGGFLLGLLFALVLILLQTRITLADDSLDLFSSSVRFWGRLSIRERSGPTAPNLRVFFA